VRAADLLAALVPEDWTGEEALHMVNALNQAIEAIWKVHGEAMADILFERQDARARAAESEEDGLF
jgi:hypothetical protein